MNVLKSRLIVTAIAMSFAATAGVALAHDDTPASKSDGKMHETMSHGAMMSAEDARKHDQIVKHDMAMKEAAAKKASMTKTGMENKATGTSMAAATTGTAAAAGAAMDQTRDASMNKDGVAAKKDAMEDRMDAREDAREERMEAKEEMLEDKADMKKEMVDEMDSSQPVTDSWITTKVKSELATTEDVSSLKISVDTVDGVVFLTGVVDNAAMVTKAAAAAKTVQGVKKVDSSGLKSM